jgi:hypothetical protein
LDYKIIYQGGKLMVSEKQLIANRENAKLGGVKTKAGKAIVKYNAVKHGLTAKEVVVRGEDPEGYTQLLDNLYAECAPHGEIETQLVCRIAFCIWRLKRGARMEADILADDWENRTPYFRSYLVKWQNVSRYETTIERQMYRAMQELERIQRARRGESIQPPLKIEVDVPSQS